MSSWSNTRGGTRRYPLAAFVLHTHTHKRSRRQRKTEETERQASKIRDETSKKKQGGRHRGSSRLLGRGCYLLGSGLAQRDGEEEKGQGRKVFTGDERAPARDRRRRKSNKRDKHRGRDSPY